MTTRRAAGWAVLALIPATLVTLAAIAGQLAEMAAGFVIAVFLIGAAVLGARLIDGGPR
ncbi:hypothetical protein ACFYY9_26340 [Streptomyces nigra]|uniref:hypothetical protein n=1 Tax=Streptomyces nigra TaxID=1827580 RepID=UPI00367D69B5